MATDNLPRLSTLFTDPFLRAAFERAEGDQGEPETVAFTPSPSLVGGAAEPRVLELA